MPRTPGLLHTPEARAKMAVSHRGRPLTAAHREKIRQGLLRALAKKRAAQRRGEHAD